jgi:hypothetical protein
MLDILSIPLIMIALGMIASLFKTDTNYNNNNSKNL